MNPVLYYLIILMFCACIAVSIKYTCDTLVPTKHKEPRKKKQTVHRRHDEICVSCGEYVPEGRMICPRCEKSYTQRRGK